MTCPNQFNLVSCSSVNLHQALPLVCVCSQGVLSLRFTLSNTAAEEGRSDIPPGLIPAHKQSVVLFLERVYGMDDKELFYSLLENAFLLDLRAATSLDKVS